MKEIEVKAYLKNKEETIRLIKELGVVLSEPIFQDGTEYAKIAGTLEEYLSNDHFVRVRTENGVHKITVKKDEKGFALSKTEYESKVDNREQIEQMLMFMGYKPILRIKKIRQKAKYKNYEICIDEVEELGSFIEIEEMSDGDTTNALVQLRDLLFTLGVSKDEEVQKGYDILMFEKK